VKLQNQVAVALINPKYPHNLAATIRACSCFGVEWLVYTGNRMKLEELTRLPREERMKGYRDVNWMQTDKPFDMHPYLTPVSVELQPGAVSLASFEHPENALYVFGPEDGSVRSVHKRHCHHFVSIPAHHCLNLSAAINVVLYDRHAKRISAGIENAFTLKETRGEIAVPGWEGR